MFNYIVASLHTSADRGRQFCQKSKFARYLTAFCANCVGGEGPWYGAHCNGHVVLQNAHSVSAVCAYILPPGGAQCGDNASYVENSGLPHAQIWGLTPQFLNVGLLGRPSPTGSVPRNGTLSIARGTTRARRRRYVEKRRKIAFGSPCSRNRKQKYGGNHANEFAGPDFLFDFVYIRGSISTPSGRL